jgi:mevalonate kinase
MTWPSFSTQVPGKWVLAGEHSVLKGVSAVALPHREISLTLSFEPMDSEFAVEPASAFHLIQELLNSVLTPMKLLPPRGQLKIESSIPIGAGLGSSAALCVALTRWMAEPLSLDPSVWVEFATQLEDRFHGKSSGMDVAVISSGEAVTFVRGRGVLPLGIVRLPMFTFHDTGIRSKTSDCVLKVENFRQADQAFGIRVDEAMAHASELAREGLVLFDSGQSRQGLQVLSDSMRKSQECFYSWGLVPDQARLIEKQLLAQGALAVKVTGAGGGGMLVALWDESPPLDSLV